MIALWAALTPIIYMLLPVKNPSDNATFISMIILAITIAVLYLTGHYQEHYVAYVFAAGLIMPPVFDYLQAKRGKKPKPVSS
jgi:predicted MFS family arabinose efflux permease